MKSNIIESLEWRYATKKFDTEKKVSAEDLNEILESGRLAPSSFGLQPWKFIVITDAKLREQLKAVSWNQPQVTDASHLIVLTVNTNVDAKFVDKYVKKIAEVRKVPVENLKGYADMMNGSISAKSSQGANSVVDWSTHQVYIALGMMLTTAAVKKIDAAPMEGFDSSKYDEMLNLKQQGLHAVALMAIGYRKDDPDAVKAKVRFDMKDIIIKK